VYVFYRSHSSSSSFYFLFTFFYFLHSLRIKIYIYIYILLCVQSATTSDNMTNYRYAHDVVSSGHYRPVTSRAGTIIATRFTSLLNAFAVQSLLCNDNSVEQRHACLLPTGRSSQGWWRQDRNFFFVKMKLTQIL